jgi:hypothetical protein
MNVERRLLELLDHPTDVAVRQPDPRDSTNWTPVS